MVPFHTSLVYLLGLSAFLCLSSAESIAATQYRVQAIRHEGQVDGTNSKRKAIEFDLTFSEDGVPMELPIFQMQLFPTTGTLSDDSMGAIQEALEEYLKDALGDRYADEEDDAANTDEDDVNDDDERSVSELAYVTVELLGQEIIEERRNRLLSDTAAIASQRTDTHHRLLRRGTQLDVRTTLYFETPAFPSERDVQDGMDEAMEEDAGVFVDEYLLDVASPQLEGVESLVYSPAMTMSSAPSMAPSSSPTEGTTRRGGVVSGANSDIPINAGGESQLSGLYPAMICGAAVFIFTILFFSSRRQRVSDEWDDDHPSEHISVDFDGRQEQDELSRELKDQQKREFHQEQQQTQPTASSPAPKPSSARKGKYSGQLQSIQMRDGSTTLHVPASIDARSSSRVYDVSPMVMSSASSVGDNSSYVYEDLHGKGSGHGGYEPSVGGELPSMMSGREFGMGKMANVIRRAEV